MIVRLRPDQLQLLLEAPGLPPRIRERVLVAAEGGRAAELEFSRDEAIEAGDALTDLVARAGFDESYAATPKGDRIEELIGKFIVD